MKSAFLQKGVPKEDQIASPAKQYDKKGGRYTDVVIDESTKKVERTHGKPTVYQTDKIVSKGMSRNRQRLFEEAMNRGDGQEGAHQLSLAKREGYGRMGKKSYISGSPGGPGPMTGSSIYGAKGIDKKSGLVIEDEKWGQKIAKRKGLFKPQPTASVTLMKGSPAKQGIGHLEKMTDRINRDKAKGKGKK